jgi:hypothetical protein
MGKHQIMFQKNQTEVRFELEWLVRFAQEGIGGLKEGLKSGRR